MTDRPETAQSNSPVTSHNSVDQCVSFLLTGQPLAIAPSGDEDNVELIRVTTTADSTHIETKPSSSSHNVSHNMRMPSALSNFPETSRNNEVSTSSKLRISIDSHGTQQQIHPYPKAAPRKSNTNNRGRRKGRSIIATDTPEKEILAAAKKARMAKKLTKKTIKEKILQGKTSKKAILQETSSDESIDL